MTDSSPELTPAQKNAARRKRYCINNAREGKCWKCPTPIFITDRGLCLRHRVIYHLQKRGLLKGVQPPGKKHKREQFIAYIVGRATAIRAGFLEPGDDAQRLKEVTELRLRLNITWGGVRGADKMADIVRALDKDALKLRKKDGQTAAS